MEHFKIIFIVFCHQRVLTTSEDFSLLSSKINKKKAFFKTLTYDKYIP